MLLTAKKIIFSCADREDHEHLFYPAERHFDVVICGGGPAGIFAATQLSNLRIQTCLPEVAFFWKPAKLKHP